MAINVALFILAPYSGILQGKPVSLCTTPQHQSKVLPITIPWLSYPTQAVQINLNQGTTNPLDKTIGMYVDNLDNNGAVLVTFPDTGYSIEIAPETSKFVPIMSQTNIVNVYNESRNILSQAVFTRMMITNFPVEPFLASGEDRSIQLFQASGTFPQGIQNFVTGVVGDQHVDASFAATFNGTTPLLTVQPSGFFVITNMQAAVYGVYAIAGAGLVAFGIQDVTAAQSKLSIGLALTTNLDYYPQKIVYTQSSEYMIMDATHNISFTSNMGTIAVAGTIQLSFDVVVIPSQN